MNTFYERLDLIWTVTAVVMGYGVHQPPYRPCAGSQIAIRLLGGEAKAIAILTYLNYF